MNSANYYRIQGAVRLVFWAVVVGSAVSAIYLVATNVWWVGDGYCFGDMLKCYGIRGE